jgi:Asp-tRNA(Asn)/Glu-tRNA(Gln) amidotransferase A subunit family amidase
MKTVDTVGAIRSGQIDLLGYLKGICYRIERIDPNIRALVPRTFVRKKVMEDASKILYDYPDPTSRPLLFGVPVGVKDVSVFKTFRHAAVRIFLQTCLVYQKLCAL